MDSSRRRNFLRIVAGAGALGLAGCNALDSEDRDVEEEDPPNIDDGGDENDNETPESNPVPENAEFEFDYANGEVTIEYVGGDPVPADQLMIRTSDGTEVEWYELGSTSTPAEGDVTVGGRATIGESVLNWPEDIDSSETVRVIFMSEDGAPTTLGTYEPDVSTPPEDEEEGEEDDEEQTEEEEDEQTDGIVAEQDIIAHWPFEDGLEDTVGGANGRAAYGDPTIGTYSGRQAVAFDGSDGIQVGDGSDNPQLSFMDEGSGPVSIAGWVYIDNESGGNKRGDYAKHHILRNDAEYWIAAHPDTNSSNTVEFVFRTNDLRGGNEYKTSNYTSGETTATIQEWHHFVFVIDPNQSLIFYLNGERKFQHDSMSGYSPRVTNYWSDQTIGSWYGTGNPDWYDLMRGKISDLRIYDKSLSDNEIEQIYINTS